MASLWIPLPFPSCVRCQRSWIRTFHRNCVRSGEIVIEPSLRQAKCVGCNSQWPVINTTFYCSCNYVFTAAEVANALSAINLLRNRLLQQVEAMNLSEALIKTKSRASFQSWLTQTSIEIGRILGVAVGKIRRWIEELS